MIQNAMFNVQTPAIQQIQSPNNELTKATPSESLKDFGSFLKDALNEVGQQEAATHQMSDQFMAGKVDVDQVMITSQQALLSLQLTTQVRNKAIEAYQEIMRTQM
ncbi:flagellar hook-basal body complex protein FliE [Paenibacillus sp. SEL1]|uniref:Flagellar hook-basal body complex protein FliE n=1 Tax=Paenibacillus polymyxa TaxID=1406 RepID=A0A1D7MNE5_PAEPO|nr:MULTISPECIES: flagellar hook-basal body complex protein FliE [Paenibacillus]KAF6637597.1 flagellar hook-basal body complex protein FliE [Paenibacillus sp. EKM208P]MCF2718608.1 flagellar hook-basal body complex protein FliE [Paenibacillus sp. UKAQ_18]AOK92360.1 flagellar hook-basal body complex protein FliE [Paenibacillus polymyxa]KYG92836.1 flagellar hook-basal body protein FliE [Paenibacillus polymyxa]MCP3777405.1 flagellar hook-basal body complex protein FliE [Paenibacillus sp. MZ03-122A]